jgi:F-type H+-transporting ATPase subunit beta
MLESGIIKYGDEFMHSMESGWDLSKVDMPGMRESKATFVFGQMNEPGARARSYLLLSISVMEQEQIKGKMYYSLLISSVLHKQVLRFRHFWSYAICSRIPTNISYRNGSDAQRITNKGSITSVQAVYVPADDLTDPAPATTFAHLMQRIVS